MSMGKPLPHDAAPLHVTGQARYIDDLPLLLAGRGAGTIRSGRRLISPKKTPMCNLHRALMERMGVKKDSFGDSTGVLQLA